MSRRPRPDDGFTLIDTLIAMVIMGVTVVALVTAMSGLIVQTGYHRGNAIAEEVTRSFVDAVTAKASSTTTLNTTMVASTATTTISLASTAPFAVDGYLAIDDEMMQVKAISSSTALTVSRSGGDATNHVGHAIGAKVVPAFRCPDAAQLSPPSSSYGAPAGVTAEIDPTIDIDYWNPTTSAFENQRSCTTSYNTRCLYGDGLSTDLRAGCDGGLERITITVKTPNDTRLKGVIASTQAMVRRGSP